MPTDATTLTPTDARWPRRLTERPDISALIPVPAELHLLGNLDLLAPNIPKAALFCSAHCPDAALLAAYDQAAHWRDTGRCVIRGFHSPVEKKCLRILLRGRQPLIICPARGLPRRLPPELYAPLENGRLLRLTLFPEIIRRVTADLAVRRNVLVAALAGETWFAHIAPGGKTARLVRAPTHAHSALSDAATSVPQNLKPTFTHFLPIPKTTTL
jgi:predicted Rossmann fold nucleotide-binding protein DprA/Smf involved in DNA uptake